MTDPHLAFAAERHGFHASAKIEVTATANRGIIAIAAFYGM
jgi:hypothetical protein